MDMHMYLTRLYGFICSKLCILFIGIERLLNFIRV